MFLKGHGEAIRKLIIVLQLVVVACSGSPHIGLSPLDAGLSDDGGSESRPNPGRHPSGRNLGRQRRQWRGAVRCRRTGPATA